MDPVTLISAASLAFNTLKKGIAIGRDLQDMTGQLVSWSSAVSDLEFLERRSKEPPWYKTLSGSVQAEAVEIFAAKKKIEQQRNELKQFISFSMGQSAWEEFLAIEAKVRKQKQQHDHRKAEIKEKITEFLLGGLLFFSGLGILLGIAYWLSR
jgi:hypothetical protein